MDPEKGPVESGLDCVGAGENSDLALFRLGSGAKRHVAPTEEDDSGCSLVGVGHEHGTIRQGEIEILGGDLQTARPELP